MSTESTDSQPAGSEAMKIPRGEFEGSRSWSFEVPFSEDRPVCVAPHSMLVVEADGAVSACEFAASHLDDSASTPLAGVWTSATAKSLREAVREGCDPEHCRRCVSAFAGEDWLATHAIVNYGDSQWPVGSGLPAHVVVRLADGEVQDGAVVERVGAVLGSIDRLTLEGTDPLRDPTARALLGRLRELPAAERPTLELRTSTAPNVESLAARLGDVRLGRLRFRCGEPLDVPDPGTALLEPVPVLPDGSDDLRGLCAVKEQGTRIDVEFVFGPRCWFELEALAQTCAEAGFGLQLHAADETGLAPIERLELVEAHWLVQFAISRWERLGGEQRLPCMGAGGFEGFVAQLRRTLVGMGERRLAGTAERASGDSRCALPPPDHAVLNHPAGVRRCLEPFFWSRGSASVQDYVLAVCQRPDAISRLQRRPWLRRLVQKVAAESPSPLLYERLRALYTDRTQTRRLLQAELEAAPWLVEAGWHRDLGIERGDPRSPAFAIPDPVTPPAEPVADPVVTVLVPSFRHEQFIERTLRSVLAQTRTDFRLLVVDDRSPDATVERASAIDDPRVEVRVNETNLGLGNSVLAALEDIDTPYLALLNSDDLFHPERLERCLEVLEQDPNAELVTTRLGVIDSDDGRMTVDDVRPLWDGRMPSDWVKWFEPLRELSPSQDELFVELLRHNFLATSSNLVCRTDFLRRNADGLRRLKYCLDWQLFLDAARSGGLRHRDEELIAYRLHTHNTVWFQGGNRWTYYLELHRVAAHAVKDSAAQALAAEGEASEQSAAVRRAVRWVVDGLGNNSDVDGVGLFLNEVVPGVRLDATAFRSIEVQGVLNGLEREFARRRDQHWALDALGDRWRESMDRVPDLARLEAAEVLRQVWGERAEQLRYRTRSAREQVKATRAELEGLYAELGGVREELQQQYRRHEDYERRLAGLQQEFDAQVQAADAMRADLEATNEVRDELEVEIEFLRAQLESEALERSAMMTRLGEIDTLRRELATERVERRRELEALKSSREYRFGNLIWNRAPLVARGARRGKKLYRKSLAMRKRLGLWWQRRKAKPQPIAVVASTPLVPHPSHTFVYEEMSRLAEVPFHVRMLAWNQGDAGVLAEGYRPLVEHALVMQPIWEHHESDLMHFQRRFPERLDALLTRIGKRTGMTVDGLRRHEAVLRACTFARWCERLRADYIHSYFFYEMSFSAMVAAWLLEIPRGISCYADHMLDDYPLKLVDLQLETADVVLATSSRIREELLARCESADVREAVAAKIVVKPNGVDGQRFPRVEGGARGDGCFELVSVCRLEPKKGLEYLIEAVERLRRAGRDVHVHLIGGVDGLCAGSSEYGAYLEGRLARSEFADAFTLHGHQPQAELPQWFGRAHCFVAPYVETDSGDKDGVPTALLEAYASGLPVVVTDSGSMLEVVEDGVEGLVVAQRDAAGLADAIDRLLLDEEERLRMGHAARGRFEERFDVSVTEPLLHERIRAAMGWLADD